MPVGRLNCSTIHEGNGGGGLPCSVRGAVREAVVDVSADQQESAVTYSLLDHLDDLYCSARDAVMRLLAVRSDPGVLVALARTIQASNRTAEPYLIFAVGA